MLKVRKEWIKFKPVFIGSNSSNDQAIHAFNKNHTDILIGKKECGELVGFLDKTMLLNNIHQNETVQFSKDYIPVVVNNEYSEENLVSKSVVFILNDSNELEGVLSREQMKAKIFEDKYYFLKNAIEFAKIGFLALDTEGRINMLNKRGRELADINDGLSSVYGKPFLSLYEDPSILEVLESEEEQLDRTFEFDDVKLLINRAPFYHKGKMLGAVSVYEDTKRLEKMSDQLEYVKNLNNDLRAIVDSSYDEIMVVDRNGTILRVSDKDKYNFWDFDATELIGKNIFDLEEKGLFKPSIIRYVVENNKKISIIQENHENRKILAVGNPIFNKDGELERVVVASRDITEISQLKEELHKVKSEKEQYKKEVDYLKSAPVLKRDLIFRSNMMKRLLMQVENIAKVDSTVMILGESGVGKDVIAENIHYLSKRKKHPFVKVNCGAIPENLLESELFGYEKGAFTGALSKGKQGMFELANKGTLFLDEIGELPLNLQVKLLQAIQDLQIMRVGGASKVSVDIRIIVATNKNLEEMVEKNLFREDLYYRLAVVPLYVPPLRERPEDVEAISNHFLKSFNQKYETNKQFSEDAIEILKAYHWPGNVRELQNIIERCVVTIPDSFISTEELTPIIFYAKTKSRNVMISEIIPLKKALAMAEEQLLIKAMNKYKNTTEIAKALGISQPTAWRKIQSLGKTK